MRPNFNMISLEEKQDIIGKHIKAILKEHQISEAGVDVSGNFQQGQQKTIAAGQQQGAAFRQDVIGFLKGAKEGLIQVGKLAITTVITFIGITCLIGMAIFKIGQAIYNAIVKFLTSLKVATIKTAQAVGKKTVDTFQAIVQKAKIAIQKGVDAITQYFKSLKDRSYELILKVIDAIKAFGAWVWGKALLLASTVKDFGQNIWNWCKKQFMSAKNVLKMEWDEGMAKLRQGWNNVKQKVQQGVDYVKSGVNNAYNTGVNAVNKVADYAGQAYGAAKGFMQGLFEEAILFYETFISIKSTDTISLINECSRITKNVIL